MEEFAHEEKGREKEKGIHLLTRGHQKHSFPSLLFFRKFSFVGENWLRVSFLFLQGLFLAREGLLLDVSKFS